MCCYRRFYCFRGFCQVGPRVVNICSPSENLNNSIWSTLLRRKKFCINSVRCRVFKLLSETSSAPTLHIKVVVYCVGGNQASLVVDTSGVSTRAIIPWPKCYIKWYIRVTLRRNPELISAIINIVGCLWDINHCQPYGLNVY